MGTRRLIRTNSPEGLAIHRYLVGALGVPDKATSVRIGYEVGGVFTVETSYYPESKAEQVDVSTVTSVVREFEPGVVK